MKHAINGIEHGITEIIPWIVAHFAITYQLYIDLYVYFISVQRVYFYVKIEFYCIHIFKRIGCK